MTTACALLSRSFSTTPASLAESTDESDSVGPRAPAGNWQDLLPRGERDKIPENVIIGHIMSERR